jgi:hypothetical protein
VRLPLLRCGRIHLGCVCNEEDRILLPMESGRYTVGKDTAESDGTSVEGTVRKMAENARTRVDEKGIEDSVRRFAEGSQVLINALDEVAKIHPFIGGKPSQSASELARLNRSSSAQLQYWHLKPWSL